MITLFDTATRSVREFVPIVPGAVSIYLCGATVQAPPHIGHIRSGVAFDVIRRWFLAQGNDVTFIRNVTDIDDKIINNARNEDVPYWLLAMRNERAFTHAYDTLGCLLPTYEPRATGHVPEMIELMQRLIDRGHAYAVDGDVYFDVRSYSNYGALSGQKIDDMLESGDSTAAGKRDARDFALWKSAKPGEPLWQTPWGPGRPGWHLECSAMAEKYLGSVFDIHCGGLDLIFPHHENEIAQSVCAGDEFARYWMHNAWVTTAGEKMSKSLGNSLLVTEVVKQVRPIELRYYLAGVHYRSMIEFSFDALMESAQGFQRIEGFLMRARQHLGVEPTVQTHLRPQAFDDAMDDDFAVATALAVLHDTVRAGNSALSDGSDVASEFGAVLAMTDVLGINPWAPQWVNAGGHEEEKLRSALDELITAAIEERKMARENKDFATADAIRDRLNRAGISIEDSADGTRWTVG